MVDEYMAWQMQPTQWVALLVMAFFTSALSHELARRGSRLEGRARWMWLACGALALGTGIWSGHFVALSGPQLPIGIGYGGWISLAGWIAAIAASLIAQAIAFRGPPAPWRGLLASLSLGLGAFVSEWLCFVDMNMAPPMHWHVGWSVAAVAATALAGFAGYVLMSIESSITPGRRWLLRCLAPLVLGTGIALGHRASALAAQMDIEVISLNHLNGLTGHSLTLLATIGTASVLAMMLMLILVERSMRHALRSAIATMEANANTDSLTSLPNFRALEARIEVAARHADRAGQSMALLFVALDGLKPINEAFGRPVGDLLLRDIATRLRTLVRNHGSLARVGGDEFALLVVNESDTEVVVGLARRLLETVSAVSSIEGRSISLSCSIGMVMYPQHGAHSTMLVHGEAAAQSVKKAGGSAASFFDAQMLAGTRDQVELLQDLRLAVAGGQLELYYQPKIHSESGAVTGAEALMRWHHPKRGMVSPGVFIPLAERHGLIIALGDWMIEEACRQIRAWRDEGLRMRVAINLSMSQLRQADLGERIAATLSKHQINPQLLTCEITESLAMDDSTSTQRFFDKLASIGVRLSIDDFGTGYSSLSYLRKLPAEELKIDRSFVLDLETSADARAVVDAVVKLAQALGLKVVAEGVETEGQSSILRALGCDQLQGFLFAKPMSAKALGLWAMTDDGPAPLAFRPSLFEETMPSPLH
jgi:diguanylate cyclase (GGDEF)-like protein